MNMKKITILFLFTVSLFFNSCEKDETPSGNPNPNSFLVSIRVLTDQTADLNLRVNYEDDSYDGFSIISNDLVEIDLKDSNSYFFYIKHETLGYIEQRFTKSELEGYSKDNPLVLDFDAHLSEIIFTVDVESPNNGGIDLIVRLFETTLYTVDWGDGTEDTKESPKMESNFASDFLDHTYNEDGNYTITVRAAMQDDVQGITIASKVQSSPVVISKIQLNDLDYLEILSLGENNLESIDETISNLPELKELSLRFGVMTDINVSKNTKLEKLLLNSSRFETIEGLYSLSKLKWLGLKIGFESVEVSNFPDLEFLNLWNNSLKEIDVSKNIKLQTLYLSNNELTEIDLSNNSLIKTLYLDGNLFKNLDISNLDIIETLDLSIAKLEEVVYPVNLNLVSKINLESADYLTLRTILDLLYESQENNPRNGVEIIFPLNSSYSNEDLQKLEALEEEFGWRITYNN